MLFTLNTVITIANIRDVELFVNFIRDWPEAVGVWGGVAFGGPVAFTVYRPLIIIKGVLPPITMRGGIGK
jgi:hypothetical protein